MSGAASRLEPVASDADADAQSAGRLCVWMLLGADKITALPTKRTEVGRPLKLLAQEDT